MSLYSSQAEYKCDYFNRDVQASENATTVCDASKPEFTEGWTNSKLQYI